MPEEPSDEAKTAAYKFVLAILNNTVTDRDVVYEGLIACFAVSGSGFVTDYQTAFKRLSRIAPRKE